MGSFKTKDQWLQLMKHNPQFVLACLNEMDRIIRDQQKVIAELERPSEAAPDTAADPPRPAV